MDPLTLSFLPRSGRATDPGERLGVHVERKTGLHLDVPVQPWHRPACWSSHQAATAEQSKVQVKEVSQLLRVLSVKSKKPLFLMAVSVLFSHLLTSELQNRPGSQLSHPHPRAFNVTLSFPSSCTFPRRTTGFLRSWRICGCRSEELGEWTQLPQGASLTSPIWIAWANLR